MNSWLFWSVSFQMSIVHLGRKTSSSATLFLGVSAGKPRAFWLLELTNELTAFGGTTTASLLLLSSTEGQGSSFKMSWLLPCDKRGSQCEKAWARGGRNAQLLVEIQPDKDIMGPSPALLPCFSI